MCYAGSYGSTPRPVFEEAQKLYLKVEACPDYFHRIYYQPYLIEAREKLAKLIGAKTEECVLVTNSSTGIANVVQNIQWEEGDTVLCSTFLPA
jgi:selenocysteine lyase/cysteine desulfurase